MANIKITLQHPIFDGAEVKFKAPCDCTAVDGLAIEYPNATEDSVVNETKTFVFKDAHGNTLAGVGNLFMAGAVVKAILDIENAAAYLQNADTNGYIEAKFAELAKPDVFSAEAKANTPFEFHLAEGEIAQLIMRVPTTSTGDIIPKANGLAKTYSTYNYVASGGDNYTGGIIAFGGTACVATFVGTIVLKDGILEIIGRGRRGNNGNAGWAEISWNNITELETLTFNKDCSVYIKKL